LVADAGVNADDRATPDIASDRMTAIVFIFLSPGFIIPTYNHGNRA
jgi:hypothetical protein